MKINVFGLYNNTKNPLLNKKHISMSPFYKNNRITLSWLKSIDAGFYTAIWKMQINKPTQFGEIVSFLCLDSDRGDWILSRKFCGFK